MTVAAALDRARRNLPGRTPDLDAELLLAAAVGQSREWVLANREVNLTAESATQFQQLLEQRRAGQPVAYLLGHKEFYGRDYVVDARVLVPRPESEHLVEAVLAAAAAGDTVLDIGTGSGCLAITVALEQPELAVLAADISPDALAVARQNADRHGAAVAFHQADLLPPPSLKLEWPRTIIMANLPYAPDRVYHERTDELAAEPALALRAGPDGLDVIRRLFAQLADQEIKPKVILLEHDPGQTDGIRKLTGQPVAFIDDLSGRPRVAVISAVPA